jgi:hypothetical protein
MKFFHDLSADQRVQIQIPHPQVIPMVLNYSFHPCCILYMSLMNQPICNKMEPEEFHIPRNHYPFLSCKVAL